MTRLLVANRNKTTSTFEFYPWVLIEIKKTWNVHKEEDFFHSELLWTHELKPFNVSARLAAGGSDRFGLCDGHFNL